MTEPFRQLDVVKVLFEGRLVGAIANDPRSKLPVFEYETNWARTGDDLAPLELPRTAGPVAFPDLDRSSFRGLPGLVADSLPGAFADLLTNAWLARHGVQPGAITAVDRLGYVGSRGVGALTFEPDLRDDGGPTPTVVDLGEAASAAHRAVNGSLLDSEAPDALEQLLDTSGSAGGARAKAAIALGPAGEVRSGQHDAPEGYSHWLLKFDVGRSRARANPTGLGRVEYAYARMAVDAGIEMSECRLLQVDGLAHFLTRRFDRPGPATRLHVQSFAAMGHLPPEHVGAHSYEQLLQTCIRLGLTADERRQVFRRIVFNIAAVVRDDHTKNHAFLYEAGRWSLAPAFDLTFAFDDDGGWLRNHQLTVNGSVHGAPRGALLELAERAKVSSAGRIIDEVVAAVGTWRDHATAAGVDEPLTQIVATEIDATALAS
ncbi:MAG: type II toxin-antitoxin system HipA family toxin [Actinomycetota bacterium]